MSDTNYTQVKIPNQVVAEVKILASKADFYIQRSKKLVDLLYKKGVTQQEIANHLELKSRQAIGLQYPKENRTKVNSSV